MLIGWRGEPGVKDEPQHVTQGMVQEELLKIMGIPYEIIDKDDKNFQNKVHLASISKIKQTKRNSCKKTPSVNIPIPLKQFFEDTIYREDVIEQIICEIPKDSIVVSTTGKTSRELFELRARLKSIP